MLSESYFKQASHMSKEELKVYIEANWNVIKASYKIAEILSGGTITVETVRYMYENLIIIFVLGGSEPTAENHGIAMEIFDLIGSARIDFEKYRTTSNAMLTSGIDKETYDVIMSIGNLAESTSSKIKICEPTLQMAAAILLFLRDVAENEYKTVDLMIASWFASK